VSVRTTHAVRSLGCGSNCSLEHGWDFNFLTSPRPEFRHKGSCQPAIPAPEFEIEESVHAPKHKSVLQRRAPALLKASLLMFGNQKLASSSGAK
jgi:hypothetical protein